MSLTPEQNELLATRFLGFKRKDCDICEATMKQAEAVPAWAGGFAFATPVPTLYGVGSTMHFPLCAVRSPDVLIAQNCLAMQTEALKQGCQLTIDADANGKGGEIWFDAHVAANPFSHAVIGRGIAQTQPEAVALALLDLISKEPA